MKQIIFLVILGFLSAVTAFAEDIGNNNLVISLQHAGQGMELAGIKKADTPLLASSSPLFSLTLQRLSDLAQFTVSSTDNWAQAAATNDGKHCNVIFTNPDNDNLPDSLRVTVTIDVSGESSQWDLSVSGVGNDHSLMDATFPELNIKAPGNDQFLIPKYSGTLIPNPVAGNMDRELYYPRGWSATMQFLSYYNDQYGIYLGFHDPKASLKHFIIKAQGGHLNFKGTYPVPDRTRPGNDWQMDGNFALDLFSGNWFDAAFIYKNWAAQHAEYWPTMTPERLLRQAALGRIGVWGYYSAPPSHSMDDIQQAMADFIDFFQTELPVPVGIHWYRWNGKDFDDDYPDYFPERDKMSALIADIQLSGNATIMPYINGRLYDTDLTGSWDYATKGKPYAAKDSNGDVYTQNFNSNTFAVMCPTQTPWQDILVDAAGQLTGRIGAGGLYIDQVCAAGPTQCMDPAHHHPLGGGHSWRDGYRDMFAKIRNTIAPEKFVIVEGGADYMADKVDGFLTDGWLADNLVPAFQAVYGGRVQLVGKKTGTSRYHNQSFYCKLGQAFVQGIEPGRQSLWIVHDSNADLARPFVKNIATMRYKLQNYLAFGAMLKPLVLSGSIPMITSSWTDYGTPVDVTLPAIQTGLYREIGTQNIAAIFVNSSMTETIDFSFTFNGRNLGCSEKLSIQKITASQNSAPQPVNNTFTKNITLAPMDTAAYIVGGCHSFPWPMVLQALIKKTKQGNP
jgi:hypothetical protein